MRDPHGPFVNLNFLIPVELHRQLKQAAYDDRRTISAMVKIAIEQMLTQQSAKVSE
jgi:predicted transcriptional regulator